MRVSLYVELTSKVDSRIIWDEIECYKVNLTDLITKNLVYGETTMLIAVKVITILAKYGEIDAKITSINPS